MENEALVGTGPDFDDGGFFQDRATAERVAMFAQENEQMARAERRAVTDEELQAEVLVIRRELRHQIISMLLVEAPGRRAEDLVEEARKIVAFIEEG